MRNQTHSASSAWLRSIHALKDKAADLALEQIQCMLDDLQNRHPKYKFSFAQVHGREWIEVTPVPVVGWQGYFAGRGVQRFDLVDIEMSMQFTKKPENHALLKEIKEILTVADFTIQNFDRELGGLEPGNHENKNKTAPGSNQL